MLIKQIILIVYLCHLTCADNSITLQKCCPRKQTLSLSQLNNKTITCIPNDEEPIHGYNFFIDVEPFRPTCDWSSRQYSDAKQTISQHACADIVHGHLHVIECKPRAKPYVEVIQIMKCCSEGYSYDLEMRKCVYTPNEFSAFANFIGNGTVAVFHTAVPKCSDDEVAVEYDTNVHDIFLIDDTLEIRHDKRSNEHLPAKSFCIDGAYRSNNDDLYIAQDTYRIIVRSCRPRNICQLIPCVRRCCQSDQMLEMKPTKLSSECSDHPEGKNLVPPFHAVQHSLRTNVPQAVNQTEYGMLHFQSCKKYQLMPDDVADSYFINYRTGKLHVNLTDEPYDVDNYCVEYKKNDDDNLIEFHAFVCFPDIESKYMFIGIGMSISAVFLCITLIVYLSMPQLLNLHGKTLVCYVTSLLIAYTSLAVVQLHTETELPHKFELAYVIFFSIMSTFFWQSIMCFDIWWKFGSIRVNHGRKTSRFNYYALYAWGLPLALTLLTLTLDIYEVLPEEWQTGFGKENTVWFFHTRWRAHMLFFILPVSIHLITNVVLFVLTSIQCSRVKSEIHRMQHSNDEKKKRFIADKAKLALNIKLFVVMGVSWIFEIITTFWQPSILLQITDAFNILQGVYVFLIFVFKRTVLSAIRKRLGFNRRTETSTPRTTTTTGHSALQMTHISTNKLTDESTLRQFNTTEAFLK